MLYYNTKIIEGAPQLPSGSNQASVNTIADMRAFLEQMYMICLLNPNDTSGDKVLNTSCYKVSLLGTYLWPVLGPFTEWSLEELTPIFGVPTNPTSMMQGSAAQSDTSPPTIPIITNDEDYQLFLQWCDKNNISLLQFNSNHSNIIKFCKFIEQNYKSKTMLNGITISEKFFSNLKKHKSKNKYLMSNLRMSICELE
jgi:hypothetical protein